MTALDADAAIRAAAARIAAAGESRPRQARDPVNLPIIENWIEAIGDASPVYTDARFAARSPHGGLVAPPAMIQVWTMRGLHPADGRAASPAIRCDLMSAALDEAGFTSVVATNCDQAYLRYLRHGEQVSVRAALRPAGPKRPRSAKAGSSPPNTWYSGDEPVATMDFRILKFRPHDCPAGPRPARPIGPAPSRPRPRRLRPTRPRLGRPPPSRTSCGLSCRRTRSSSGAFGHEEEIQAAVMPIRVGNISRNRRVM